MWKFVQNSGKGWWLWPELRKGQQGKKFTGRPETWEEHSVSTWDPKLHCDTSKDLHASKQPSPRWVALELISVYGGKNSAPAPELFSLWFPPTVTAGLSWRTWISRGSTGTNRRGKLPGGRLRTEGPPDTWEYSVVEEQDQLTQCPKSCLRCQWCRSRPAVNSHLPALQQGKAAVVRNAWAAKTSWVLVALQTLCFPLASPPLWPRVVTLSVGTGFTVKRLTLVLQDLMVVVCYKLVQLSLLLWGLETSSSGSRSPWCSTVCHIKARKTVRGQQG